MIKISVVTVVRNNESTIAECISSVYNQTLLPVEHIIIDGKSTDRTLEVIDEHNFPTIHLVSEFDDGIYDAMNKGIKLAKGNIIGILNSDDLYDGPHVLDTIARTFEDPSIDACYSDLVYVNRSDTDKVIRYWKSKHYYDDLFEKGWVPPHPTFFVRREVYERLGLFDLRFRIAADFELMLRYLAVSKINACYLPLVTVRMRMGGTTNKSVKNIIKQNIEIIRALKMNNKRISLMFPLYKLTEKLSQYYLRN
jgi:glycosyltransferase involved in cell wall biosynthesis